MPIATVTSKGQITIPIDVRHKLGLDTGDRVQFVELDDGGYELVPSTASVSALKGIVPSIGKVVTLEEMDEAIASAASETMHT
ncbi:MAG: AbrB/MazE/SpoVT family DNA-binding domain-containing protein [Microbacteriaceae bacterium]|nr:MAG: AbrB/MazE/SpoVT family DNA-binding domain-containing protein [Microbacteriaceae bacterium]